MELFLKFNPQSAIRATYLRDTSDHVVDEGFDGPQACDVFPASLPDSKGDFVRLSLSLALDEPDIHANMLDVLVKRSTGSSYSNEPRLDGDCYIGGDRKLFGLEDVTHLEEKEMQRSVCSQ
jgi:hypothetical protein